MTINDVVEERGYRAICVPNGKSRAVCPRTGTSGADACRSVHACHERRRVLEGGEENPQPGRHPAGHHDGRQRPDDRHQGRRDGPLQAGRLRRADPPPADVLRGARGVALNDGRRSPSSASVGQGAERYGAPVVAGRGVRARRPAPAASATPALGAPDSFLLVAPVPPRDGARASKSKSGFPVVAKVPHRRSPRGPASPAVRGRLRVRGAANRLPGQAADPRDRRRRPPLRATGSARRPREPTVLIMGGARAGGPTSRGIALKGSFGGEDEHADVLAVAVDAYPDHDRALSQTLAGALGAAGGVARGCRRRPGPDAPAGRSATRGRWRSSRANGGWGRARRAMLPADAGTAAQRDLFAAVRENRYALGADGAPRPARELLADPERGRHRPLPPGAVEDRRPEDRARRGLRAVRQGSRPRGDQPGGGARAVPQLPGEAAVGLGARGAGGQPAREHRRSRRRVRARAAGGALGDRPHLRGHDVRRRP